MKRNLSFIAKLSVVAILFFVLFSYAMFQGGFVSWFLFTAFAPFLLYMFGLLLYPLHNWKVERNLSKRIVQAGEQISVEVTIRRKTPFPLYYCVVEEFFPESLKKKDDHLEKYKHMDQPDILLQNRKMKRVSFPWFKRTIRHTYELDEVPRGEHRLWGIRVKTGDFFGFLKKEHVYRVDHTFLAYPYQREVRLKERAYSFEQGSSPSLTVNYKNTNIVSGVRDYMPGDRYSWIDWKSTARKNTIMTKEFEQEKSMDMLLVLDASESENLTSVAFEGMVELTNSLMDEIRRRTSQLAIMTLGNQRIYFPFHSDQSNRTLIQKHLSVVQPTGEMPFAQQLEKERAQMPNGLVTLVVTSEISLDLNKALERLSQKSKRVTLFVVRPKRHISELERKWLKQLSFHNITVNILTEDQFTQREFEVST
ncbi:DUF58 domain-containing protein [Thalassobacillus hwangdonensis]|uniref:DUF58 domain-containing protein n=1 Tax=Thalassobacillus hwangdonensis TaxID=546108 RepID=A0ABW3L4V8_9BACI